MRLTRYPISTLPDPASHTDDLCIVEATDGSTTLQLSTGAEWRVVQLEPKKPPAPAAKAKKGGAK